MKMVVNMVMHLSSNSNLVDIFDDKYHQVVINFSQDESVARLYIDEVLHDQYQVPTQINSSYTGTPLTFFGDLNTGSYFEGDIDYLFFSKDLISFDQINDFIDSNIHIDTDTFFQFNTGSGNQFYDYSGNFNHGSLYGPIWIWMYRWVIILNLLILMMVLVTIAVMIMVIIV